MALLNNRLLDFCIENQLGFLPGNPTADAQLIIHNLIQKRCHKTNSKIYSCFIDFSNAVDTTPLGELLNKLLGYDIKGNLFNSYKKHIYE